MYNSCGPKLHKNVFYALFVLFSYYCYTLSCGNDFFYFSILYFATISSISGDFEFEEKIMFKATILPKCPIDKKNLILIFDLHTVFLPFIFAYIFPAFCSLFHAFPHNMLHLCVFPISSFLLKYFHWLPSTHFTLLRNSVLSKSWKYLCYTLKALIVKKLQWIDEWQPLY
jgi:hypothetical protein